MDATYNLTGGFKPTIKRSADLSGPDFFPTPRWATFALIDNEDFSGDIWECACGDGSMSRVLEETACSISSTDLYERGYGEVGHDFLKATQRMPNDEQDSSQFVVRSIATQAFLAVARARRRAYQPAMSFTQCRLV